MALWPQPLLLTQRVFCEDMIMLLEATASVTLRGIMPGPTGMEEQEEERLGSLVSLLSPETNRGTSSIQRKFL